jgi:AsmA protein
MRGLFKFIGYLILLAVIVLVVAGAYLTLYFDPNEHKALIVAKVEEATGRDFAIDGDIGLTLFPWLGVSAKDVQLGNAPGFGDQPFARVGEADVAVKILPLLAKRQLEVGTVTLRGVDVQLAKDAEGRGNWEDLAGAAERGEAAGTEPGRKGRPEQGLASLAVEGVTLEDTNLTWDDRSTGQRYELRNLTLHTSEIAPGKPVGLDLALGFHAAEPAMEGRLDLKARAHVSHGGRRARLEGAKLRLGLTGENLPGGKLDLDLAADAELDLEQETLGLTGLVLKALGLELSGELQGSGILQSPTFAGKLQLASFPPRELWSRLWEEAPKTADPKVLSTAAVSLALSGDSDRVELTDIDLTLDASRLTGQASVRDFRQPRIGFDLQLDRIDLDAYRPPDHGAPSGESASAPVPEAQVGGSPLEALRSLNLDGSLAIGALKVYHLRTTDLLIKVKAADGVLDVKPANGQLYDGQLGGSARLDARGKDLETHVQWKLSGIRVGPLLADLTGSDVLQGTGNVGADLSLRGETPEDMQRSLGGTAGVVFTNGAYKGVNIAYEIRKAKAVLKRKPAPPEEPRQTDFSELQANFKIDRGVVRNDDLLAKSPLLRVTGKGLVDLPKQEVDYTVYAVITGTLTGQGGKDLKDLEGIKVPVRVSGPMTDPGYKVMLEDLLTDQAKKKVEKEVRKQVDKVIGEDTRKRIEEAIPGLGGLFR